MKRLTPGPALRSVRSNPLLDLKGHVAMTLSDPGRDDIATDLKLILAARRDIGPELDDELVDLFLARVDAYIDSRVAAPAIVRRDPARPRWNVKLSLWGIPL